MRTTSLTKTCRLMRLSMTAALLCLPIAGLADPPDFNGDGYADLAVGAPNENIGTATDAGAVNVLYGSGSGLSAAAPILNQFWYQGNAGVPDSAESYDRFGGALAWGDFNGDGYCDLAIGASGENLAEGAVTVLYGSSNGLDAYAPIPAQRWDQNSTVDVSEADDYFGNALAAGDFNNDGYEDLAIGSYFESLDASTTRCGTVTILYGSSAGLRDGPAIDGTGQFAVGLNQKMVELRDAAEAYDFFGASLTTGDFNGDGCADLVIGVSGEDIGLLANAGAVHVLYGSSTGLRTAGSRFVHQDTKGVLDVAEAYDYFGSDVAAGDFNGDGYDDLAVGVPSEDIGATNNAGAVNVLYGSVVGIKVAGDQFWHQNRSGVEDTAESDDNFGSDVAAGDFNGDGYADLAVGVPLEDSPAVGNAGAVNVLYGSSAGLRASSAADGTGRTDQFWHQNNTLGVIETNDYFGWTLAVADFNNDGRDDLAAGAPDEDTPAGVADAGAVVVLYGFWLSNGLDATGCQYWDQDATIDAAEADDGFGDGIYGH